MAIVRNRSTILRDPDFGSLPLLARRHPPLAPGQILTSATQIARYCCIAEMMANSNAEIAVRWQMASNKARLLMTKDCQAGHRTETDKREKGYGNATRCFFSRRRTLDS